jgi:hypothetical protein
LIIAEQHRIIKHFFIEEINDIPQPVCDMLCIKNHSAVNTMLTVW